MDPTVKLTSLPEVLNVDEVATYLRVSKTMIYEAIARKQLHAVRLGKRHLIKRETLLAFLSPQAPA